MVRHGYHKLNVTQKEAAQKKNVWDLYGAVLLRNHWISAAKLTHNMLAFNYIN